METSDSYIVVEKMIHRAEVSKSELQHLLNSLEEQGQITATEHQALLALAEELSRDKASPQ
jgi:hypothetical protein